MTKKKSRHNVIIKAHRNKRLEDVPTLYDAVEFFLEELLKRCTIDYRLNIKIVLKYGDVIAADGSKNVGLAWEHSTKGNKWYIVHISNDAPFLEMLSTIAHEMVHVVQFATGRLVIDEDDNWIWDGVNKGKAYKGTEVDNQLPWEYDAYSKEIELSRKFVKKFYSNW